MVTNVQDFTVSLEENLPVEEPGCPGTARTMPSGETFIICGGDHLTAHGADVSDKEIQRSLKFLKLCKTAELLQQKKTQAHT